MPPATVRNNPANSHNDEITKLFDCTDRQDTMTSQPSFTLKADIAAYEKMREALETNHLGKWVVFHKEELVGAYDSLAFAAYDAVQRFGDHPFLIRQVGEGVPVRLPSFVQYGIANA